MADQRTIDIYISRSLNFGLQLLGAGDLKLKEKQYEVLKSVVIDNKDVWSVLPTGYGKSLIYQLLARCLPAFTISWTSLDHQETKSRRLL